LTTWTSGKITRKIIDKSRSLKHFIYTIDGVSGDTGGALTIRGVKKVEYASVHVEIDTGPAGYTTGLLYTIAANVVTIEYTNPSDGHTVRVEVWGK
jgi:hypothetical protein